MIELRGRRTLFLVQPQLNDGPKWGWKKIVSSWHWYLDFEGRKRKANLICCMDNDAWSARFQIASSSLFNQWCDRTHITSVYPGHGKLRIGNTKGEHGRRRSSRHVHGSGCLATKLRIEGGSTLVSFDFRPISIPSKNLWRVVSWNVLSYTAVSLRLRLEMIRSDTPFPHRRSRSHSKLARSFPEVFLCLQSEVSRAREKDKYDIQQKEWSTHKQDRLQWIGRLWSILPNQWPVNNVGFL